MPRFLSGIRPWLARHLTHPLDVMYEDIDSRLQDDYDPAITRA